MYYYSISGLNTPYQSDIGTVPARPSAIDMPGTRNIFDLHQSSVAQLDAKTIRASLFITGDTDAQRVARLRQVKALLGNRLQLYRRWDDGALQSINARLVEQKGTRRPEDKNILSCEMIFSLMDEAWFGNLSAITSAVSVATTFTYDDNISNDGNAPHKTPVFHLTNINASIDDIDIQIYDGTTGTPQWHLTWENTQGLKLADLEIAPPYVSSGAISRGSNHKRDGWLALMPGLNRVIVTGTSATSSLTLSIQSYPRWV